MAFSSNFTKVKRGRDDAGQEAVFVEGTTADSEQALTAMYVNLVQPPEVQATRNGTITLPEFGALTEVPVENAPAPSTGARSSTTGRCPRSASGSWRSAWPSAASSPRSCGRETLQVERFG